MTRMRAAIPAFVQRCVGFRGHLREASAAHPQPVKEVAALTFS